MNDVLGFAVLILAFLWIALGVIGAIIIIMKRFSLAKVGCLFIVFSPLIVYFYFVITAVAGLVTLIVSLVLEGKKRCPHCRTGIPGSAVRCPNCSSHLGGPSSMIELAMAYGLLCRDFTGALYLKKIRSRKQLALENVDIERQIFDMLRLHGIPARNAGSITRLVIQAGLSFEEAKQLLSNTLNRESTLEEIVGLLESGIWISEKATGGSNGNR